MKLTMIQVKEVVMNVLRARLVPFLQSSPGVGKSTLAAMIAKEQNLKLLDIRLAQCDPTDLNGLPFVHDTPEGKRAGYLPLDLWPLEGQALPLNEEGKPYQGWLILLDEINSASPAVQASAYKLLLDRQVGMYRLHPRALLMAAGNLSTDKAIVNRMSTAMESRLIHLQVEADLASWIAWADTHDIDYRIKSFINFKPDALHNFDPNHHEQTYACPRTWEFVSKLIKPFEKLVMEHVPMIAGAIGEGMAREFYSFTQMYGKLPDFQDILKNPTNIEFENEPGIQYALTGLVAHNLSKNNIEQVMPFIERLNIDFQVICLKAAFAKDSEIKKAPCVKDFIVRCAKELM